MNINSGQDLQNVLNYGSFSNEIAEEIKQKELPLEETENYLDLADRYKRAHAKSLAFVTSLEFVKGIDRYKTLLAESLNVLDALTPDLVDAFQCHKKAKEFYLNPKAKMHAIMQMEKTNKIAEKITRSYLELYSKIQNVQKDQFEIQSRLSEDENTLMRWNNSPLIQQGLSYLKTSLEDSWEIDDNLVKMRLFCRSTLKFIDKLASSNLSNPQMVEALETPPESDDFTKIEEQLNAALPPPKQLTPEEVYKSMRTGTRELLNPVPKIVTVFRAINKSEIEKSFEDSYLKWLTLAKVNATLMTHMQSALSNVNNCQTDILSLEQDRRVTALNRIGQDLLNEKDSNH